ncbi:hypothetical protein FBU31_001200, partial [Coemansia sp. 'formosensis']
MDVDRDNDDIAALLTTSRLNEIKRVVSSFKTTWPSLRSQYPPKQSLLAPLSLTDNRRAALDTVGVTELDANLAVDEAYSQAATMSAYGVELLRIALTSSLTNRRRIQQAMDILATLCATFTDMRDRQRGYLTRTVLRKVDDFRHEQGMDDTTGPMPQNDEQGMDDATWSMPQSDELHRCIGDHCGPMIRWRVRRVSRQFASSRSNPYYRRDTYSEAPRLQQTWHDRYVEQRRPVPAWQTYSTEGICLPTEVRGSTSNRPVHSSADAAVLAPVPLATIPESDNRAEEVVNVTDNDSPADSQATSSVAEVDSVQSPSQELPRGLRRRDVIRDALMRQ